MLGEKMKRTMNGDISTKKTTPSRTKPVIITDDVYNLMMDITTPLNISHNSSHADMIRNVVLGEVRERIAYAYSKNSLRS